MMVKELVKKRNIEAHDHANDVCVIDHFFSNYLKTETKNVKMNQNEQYVDFWFDFILFSSP